MLEAEGPFAIAGGAFAVVPPQAVAAPEALATGPAFAAGGAAGGGGFGNGRGPAAFATECSSTDVLAYGPGGNLRFGRGRMNGTSSGSAGFGGPLPCGGGSSSVSDWPIVDYNINIQNIPAQHDIKCKTLLLSI